LANFWFALDVGAYNKKTANLTLLEHGVYFALMRHYYATGEPLPSEASRLQRICRAHSDEELKAISFVIASFFTLKRGSYHNDRCDEEIVKAKEVSNLRKDLGRKGGLAKAKAIAVANGVANDLAKSYTVTVTDTNTKPERKKRAHSLPEDFLPNPTHYDIARQVGVIVDMEFPKFRDFFLGNGALKVDWDRTFNNWLRNAPQYGGNRGRNNANSGTTQQTRQPSAQVARFHNNRAEVERAFGAAAVGGTTATDRAGQTPRLGSRDTPALEGEITKL